MPAGKVDFDNPWRTHVERNTPIRWRTLQHVMTTEEVTIFGWCGHPPASGPWVGWTIDQLPADKSTKGAPLYRWEFWKQIMVGREPVGTDEPYSAAFDAQHQWITLYPQSREDDPNGPFRRISIPNYDELVLTLGEPKPLERPKKRQKKIK